MTSWKKKAQRKKEELAERFCGTFANTLPVSPSEKEEVNDNCITEFLKESPSKIFRDIESCLKITDNTKDYEACVGFKTANPPDVDFTKAETPQEAKARAECETEAQKATSKSLEGKFRSWCYTGVNEEYKRGNEDHLIRNALAPSERITTPSIPKEQVFHTSQQAVKKTDTEKKNQAQDATLQTPNKGGKDSDASKTPPKTIFKGIKVRIYPNKEQEILLNKTLGSCRFLYNKMLEERKKVYEQLKGDKDKLDLHKYKTEAQYKEEFAFLKEVDSTALQSATNNLIQAFKNFSKGRKKGRKVGYPKFKSKRGKQTYTTKNVNNSIRVKQTAKRIKLPKVGWMKYRDNRDMNYKIKRVTISKTQKDIFFAAILVELESNVQPLTSVQLHKIEAYDMSAVNFLVSEKIKLSNPRFYRSQKRKLKRLHRRLSRKQNGSQNREKARVRLAKLYEKIQNRKKDWMHKLTHDLSIQRDAVILEDLNIEGMKQFNKGLSKSVTLDFSWNQFTTYLKYKMARQGKYLIKVDRFFPSSKQCSVCGQIANDLQLSDRTWTCPCGATHDRDVNASINLKQEGIRILENQGVKIRSTVGTTGSHASGDRVRPASAGSGQGTRKPSAFRQ